LSGGGGVISRRRRLTGIPRSMKDTFDLPRQHQAPLFMATAGKRNACSWCVP